MTSVTAIAKITSKGQTTIPADIRTALKVEPGDSLVWEMLDSATACVRRIQPVDIEYLEAVAGTLSEWGTLADDEAYGDL